MAVHATINMRRFNGENSRILVLQTMLAQSTSDTLPGVQRSRKDGERCGVDSCEEQM